ncbi:universal stress protein [Glycomyces sp. YM15]|uniref:universal stress protein n=1 Tax=Glycomyces sp. YM15 TaxID=2800446 RepID=UPI0019624782|nr:universal stress protein [Glycomyces sp. YM15]
MMKRERAPGRIVVGVDGSASSVQALRWALRQAELAGAQVEAVLVLDTTTSLGMAMTIPPFEDLLAEGERSLAQAVARAAGEQTDEVIRTVEYGHPATVLIERGEDADLLVLGNRGHGGFRGALLGSVGYHCIQHASCPVVVVPTGR